MASDKRAMMAHELRMSQTMRTISRFRELLGGLTIGDPTHHHNLTFFPLLWPQAHKPSYKLLSTAIESAIGYGDSKRKTP
jgi:hypothetical protein